MPLALPIKTDSHIRTLANTIAFYAQINQALAGHGETVRVRIQTPTKEITFTAETNSAHALITCVATNWSGAEVTIQIATING